MDIHPSNLTGLCCGVLTLSPTLRYQHLSLQEGFRLGGALFASVNAPRVQSQALILRQILTTRQEPCQDMSLALWWLVDVIL